MLKDKVREYIRISGYVETLIENAKTSDEIYCKNLGIDNAGNEKYFAMIAAKSKDLENLYVELYAKYYDEADMDILIAFFKSNTAEKMKAIGNKFSQEAILMVSEFGRDVLRQISKGYMA